MAVENKYVASQISGNVTNKLMPALAAQGSPVTAFAQTFEIAAADDDTSVYRVFKNVSPNLIPLSIQIWSDAITSGTDYEMGIYRPDLGTVISKGVFQTGQTLASATTFGGVSLYGMAAVNIADVLKRIFEHAGHTVLTKLEAYDLCLTADTVGSAAGTVTVVMLAAQG